MNPVKVLVLIALLAGCATVANTPAQDRTWAAIDKCKALQPATMQVNRVYADGRSQWSGWSHGGQPEWMTCISAGGPR
jgi:uncharacterized lipoprotein YajG